MRQTVSALVKAGLFGTNALSCPRGPPRCFRDWRGNQLHAFRRLYTVAQAARYQSRVSDAGTFSLHRPVQVR